MKKRSLAVVVAAGLLTLAACDRDSDSARPNAQTPSQSQPGQSAQTSPPRQGPGQSARPGDLSPAESEPVRPAPGVPPSATESAAPSPSSETSVAAQSFDAVDVDKSGTVDQAEARAIPDLNFSTADADRDETLSRQEFMTAMAGSRPPG
jgi:hypothetical protein